MMKEILEVIIEIQNRQVFNKNIDKVKIEKDKLKEKIVTLKKEMDSIKMKIKRIEKLI